MNTFSSSYNMRILKISMFEKLNVPEEKGLILIVKAERSILDMIKFMHVIKSLSINVDSVKTDTVIFNMKFTLSNFKNYLIRQVFLLVVWNDIEFLQTLKKLPRNAISAPVLPWNLSNERTGGNSQNFKVLAFIYIHLPN